ncbi:MAG TPA: dephospho-CoA kinase [Thermoplasmatales archaeon]|nr:dephospho-CoA kinase [Thermoplasmatales archaeon]
MVKIIAFTGMPWSGKTEAVAVAREMNLPVFRMGDLVWEEVERQGLSVDAETVGRIANEMREKYSGDIWARRTCDKIKSMVDKMGSYTESRDFNNIIIIDGVRSLDEVNYFKKFFGEDFIIIAIIASDEIRRQRALTRNRKDDADNILDIKKRDEREIKWGLPSVIEDADYVIRNEDTLKSFQIKIRKLLETIAKR